MQSGTSVHVPPVPTRWQKWVRHSSLRRHVEPFAFCATHTPFSHHESSEHAVEQPMPRVGISAHCMLEHW
jgi:hypothetical protein